jgi:hypothetical protein
MAAEHHRANLTHYLRNAPVEVGNDTGLHRYPALDFGGTAGHCKSAGKRVP